MKYLSVYGTEYEATEPCYLTTVEGKFVFDRVMNRWLEWVSLAAKVAAEGHTWQPREVGIPSIGWQLNNSRMIGQKWAPGLNNTSGLASEQITNGEDWAGASGTTPPTGWTSLGDEVFEVTGGWLTVTAVRGAEVGQSLSGLEDGKTYVIEIGVGGATEGDHWLQVGPYAWPIGNGSDKGAFNAVTKAATFTKDEGPAWGMEIMSTSSTVLELEYLRIYEEAELTGSGGIPFSEAKLAGSGVTAFSEPEPEPQPVKKKKKKSQEDE